MRENGIALQEFPKAQMGGCSKKVPDALPGKWAMARHILSLHLIIELSSGPCSLLHY